MLFVDARTKSERLLICNDCPHFVDSTQSCGTLVKEAFTDSPLCGCHMPTKARLKIASCPLGKWDAIITEKDLEIIREFLDRPNGQRTKQELMYLSEKYLAGKKASSCPPCNATLMKELERIVNHAASESKT